MSVFRPIYPSEETKRGGVIAGLFFALLTIGIGTLGFLFSREHIAFDTSLLPRIVSRPVSFFASAPEGAGDAMPLPPMPLLVPRTSSTLPDPASFSSAALLVEDGQSKEVLYAKNPDGARPIASITKLMSALVLLERPLDWGMATSVIPYDGLSDTHMYAGDIFTVDEFWHAMLIGSSNKAVLTLARVSGWTEEAFVARMNEKAMEIGMEHTRFADPSGLDDRNISTARDVAILLREALREDRILSVLSLPEYTLPVSGGRGSHHMWNTNWLMLPKWIPHDFGSIPPVGKTGYTVQSGFNFAGKFTEESTGHQLFVIALGADAHEKRFTETRDIARWVFDTYVWP
jgi:D-alanyl-D-alanine carboxypeptidase